MINFKQYIQERCWTGYKSKPGSKPYEKGSCVKEEQIDEISRDTLLSYANKVSLDSQKHSKDPTRRSPEKASRSVAGYAKAVNRLEKPVKEETEELDEVAAWQRKEGKSEAGGLNRKGIESYRRENPGSKLSMAVTTKPSKLDPDSKAAKRRKSFCARMGGMKKRLTSAKTANDPDSRINKALRKWNC